MADSVRCRTRRRARGARASNRPRRKLVEEVDIDVAERRPQRFGSHGLFYDAEARQRRNAAATKDRERMDTLTSGLGTRHHQDQHPCRLNR